MMGGESSPSETDAGKKNTTRHRQTRESTRPVVSSSALDQVPPIAQLKSNTWTRLPIQFTTPKYLGTLSTNTSGNNIISNTISSPIVRLGDNFLAAGTIGGDVVLWDLHPVVQLQSATAPPTTQPEDHRPLHMPTSVFRPPSSELSCRVIQLLASPGEADPDIVNHSAELENPPTTPLKSTLLALCATGLVHFIEWRSYEKKLRIAHSWWSPHPISKGAILDSKNTLVLSYDTTVCAYDISSKGSASSSSEPKLLWTLRSDTVVHDFVPLGEHLLVLVLAGSAGVQVVDVRSVARVCSSSSTAHARVEDHVVLATPGREIIIPAQNHQHRSGTSGHAGTSLSYQLNSTRSVVCLNGTLVVVLETSQSTHCPDSDDGVPASWGVATDRWDEIQLPYGCAGFGSLGESNLVAALAAGTTYVWDRAGICRSFLLPVHEPYDDDGMGLQSFTCCSLIRNDGSSTTVPIFMYHWPMNVVDIFGLAVDDSPLLEELISTGVANDLRTLVLNQAHDDASEPLWPAAAYQELSSEIETSLTLIAVQAMPVFRSLLLALATNS